MQGGLPVSRRGERGNSTDLHVSVLLAIGFVGLAWFLSEHLDAEEEHSRRTWFALWLAKGYLAPLLVWLLLALGWFPGLPPLLAHVFALRGAAGQSALDRVWTALNPAILVVGSFWLAFTLGTLLERLVPRVAGRRELLLLAAFWAVLVSPLIWLILRRYSWAGLGLAASVWLVPLVQHVSGLQPPRPVQTFYSRAVGLMKRGKFDEAEWAVIAELEKREDDYDGWMLLAELYATRFDDLPSAVQTISDLIAQPDLNPSQVAVALHRLADWQLQLARDPGAARLILEQIDRRYPGSHLAYMAQLRIRQLPADRAALEAQQRGKPVPLPAWKDTFAEALELQGPPLPRETAAAQANQFSARLVDNPSDLASREAFARLLAEHLGKVDLALEQLELLQGITTAAEAQKADWLTLQAAWHLRYRQDREAAKRALERVLRDHPATLQAFSAQRHLSLMRVQEDYRRIQKAGRS